MFLSLSYRACDGVRLTRYTCEAAPVSKCSLLPGSGRLTPGSSLTGIARIATPLLFRPCLFLPHLMGIISMPL